MALCKRHFFLSYYFEFEEFPKKDVLFVIEI